MLRIVSDRLWSDLKKLARGSSKAAAVAYVTSDRYLKFRQGDVLVCDATDPAIQAGQTSRELLRDAVDRGAHVYSLPGLHAKVLVFERTAVIGSGNLSAASANSLVEAAVITDDIRAVTTARAFVEQLRCQADRIDARFLERVSKLEVTQRTGGSRRRRSIPLRGPRAWVVNLKPLDEARYAAEATVVEAERRKAAKNLASDDSDAAYVRWVGRSRFRAEARPEDVVVALWRPSGSSRRPVVYHPAPLLHRKDVGKATHFFIEEYADAEDTALPFGAFQKLWRRIGGAGVIRPNSTREVSVDDVEALRRLWPC